MRNSLHARRRGLKVLIFLLLGLQGGGHPAVARTPPRELPAALLGQAPPPGAIWLEDLDWQGVRERLIPRRSAKDTPITLAGQVFPHGLGGTGRSTLRIALDGLALAFVSAVGIDDVERSNGSKRFELWVDDRKVAESRELRKGERQVLSAELTGASLLELVVDHGGAESDWDRFAWAGAYLVLTPEALASGRRPRPFELAPEPTSPIASARGDATSINGPLVVGGTPGRPFLYLIPVSGKRPLRVQVAGLPRGLHLDPATGIVSGTLPGPGRWELTVTARGPGGRARRALTVVAQAGAAVKALTPPMGWNSWNVWGMEVDAAKIRAAADAMVQSGLAQHGYRYVNIDDGWAGRRDACGELVPTAAFGDVAALAEHVHAHGLKLGIYSSPGPKTCGGAPGSYQHEAQDARTFARWGVDLLKYDYCSFDELKRDGSPGEQRRPYEVMQGALARVERDIVYSVCNYGRGQVWTWGAAVDGNLWRTTSDITDSWTSLDGIAFSQDDKAPYTAPGHYGDPDMLVVGKLGWGGSPRPTHLSGNEQILHLTHWAMLAAPLLIGCDMTQLDDFTFDLLANDEVIAIDQDPLARAARRRLVRGRAEVWSRPLHDGAQAVALYNRGRAAAEIAVTWAELGLTGPQQVRDLWQRRDLGRFAEGFSARVPQHGAVLLRLTRAR